MSVEESTTLLTPKKITVFPGTKKVGPICPTFIRGDPYEPQRLPEKSIFQTISWGGSRYLKVVNPHVWHQSWYDMRFQPIFGTSHPLHPRGLREPKKAGLNRVKISIYWFSSVWISTN